MFIMSPLFVLFLLLNTISLVEPSITSNLAIRKACNTTELSGDVNEDDLLSFLTEPCRYNRLERPPTSHHSPVKVSARVFIYFLKATTSTDLKFQAQILLQLVWEDPRLNFSKYNVSFDTLIGEKYLMDTIWIPHVFLSNEKDSLVMGFLRKDDFIVVHSSGSIRFTTRLKTKVTCHMELGKFPFDVQKCSLVMDSWRYNSSELILDWEQPEPVQMQGGKVRLTEFSLVSMTAESSFVLHHSSRDFNRYNYSCLVLTFTMAREYGFYIMDYYIPSVLLVILSWVSFWLTPDALPARINLGTSTMLTFLLLGWTATGMPQVSQFKSNNIWAVGCTLFIFLSLVEFAFVNTIDRSGNHKVPVKKPTSKYILKTSLTTTPSRMKVRRTSSLPSSPEVRRHFAQKSTAPRHKILQELRSGETELSKQVRLKVDEGLEARRQANRSQAKDRRLSRRLSILPGAQVFTMTPQEIARWIDEKSRIIFPTSFLIFCLFYWSFLWI